MEKCNRTSGVAVYTHTNLDINRPLKAIHVKEQPRLPLGWQGKIKSENVDEGDVVNKPSSYT
jgi:hypothetical protein